MELNTEGQTIVKRKPGSFAPGNQAAKGLVRRPQSKHLQIAHVQELARRYTKPAVRTLAEIMQNKEATDSARVSAACALLDRGWGKAPQEVSVAVKHGTLDWTRDELIALLNAAARPGDDAQVIDASAEPVDSAVLAAEPSSAAK